METITIARPKLSRRDFLKMIGAAGILTLPALGYGLFRVGGGELPRTASPYVTDDASGQPLSSDRVNRPLLLLTNERAENLFGAYLAEILRAEGLNCFRVARLSSMNSATLGQFSLVLLAEGPLDQAQVELLGSYVARGGRLIAMRPDARLAPLLGLERTAGSTAEGYVQVDTDHPVGQGIVAEALQFHGSADHYRLAGAQAVAWLVNNDQARTDFPAVTLHRYGQGQAAMWAYDLGRSVAYMRQGNLAWANQERDGRDGLRAQDAFVGWIDLDRIAIPQADEQMRLLSQLVSAMLSDVLPLPRLWYFPSTAEGMLIATGDAHQSPASAIEDVLARVEQRQGHMSIYYAPPLVNDGRRTIQRMQSWMADLSGVGKASADLPTPSQVAGWRARGHEFTLHPYVEEGLEAGWQRYWKEFTGRGYGPVSSTVRTHRILWTGWVETARLQASYGIRMNLDYYHYGPAFQDKTGKWMYGHFIGSGLPMRFVDEQGRILNIYQQPTQLVDEQVIRMPWGLGGAVIPIEAAIEIAQTLLHRCLTGAYSAVAAQFHIDPFTIGGDLAVKAARWLEGTLDYAAAQGIPIWSAAEWLDFTETRHNATLDRIQWDPLGRRLSFHLVAPVAPHVDLTVLVPQQHGQARLARVEIDGVAITYHQRNLSGNSYAGIPVKAGPHQIVAIYQV